MLHSKPYASRLLFLTTFDSSMDLALPIHVSQSHPIYHEKWQILVNEVYIIQATLLSTQCPFQVENLSFGLSV